ncbi:MAG: hypothetical protein A2Y86_01890 [Candidatus Aminicenantes bacterium RBG_13_62_12]|nr:MAG: hypothetical protein A2Y86_01890 [Candidatus Aminicenantes bacterium RBG_13_62_12]
MIPWAKSGILALVSLLISSACVPQSSGPRSAPPPPRETDALPRLPETYRMVHRIRLEVRGRSFDMIGYLAVRGGDWRAVAYSELGGRLFDFLCRPPRKEVLFAPKGLPHQPLREGVMNDLSRIFTSRPAPSPDRVETSVRIRSYCSVEGWPEAVPERLTIENRRWGYVMEVHLLRMDLRPVDDRAFRTGDGAT